MFKIINIFQVLFLILVISLVSNFAVAQSTEDKQDEDKNQTSLEGLTEAILFDGQPALKIIGKKNSSTEVLYQKRDSEDALVFFVLKFPNSGGKLFVTKTRVIYDPDGGKKRYFNIEKSEVVKLTISKVYGYGNIGRIVKIEFRGDKIPFSVTVGLDKFASNAASSFLFRAIKDFDSALAEFNKLTASIRQDNEDGEEIEEEETESEISDKYDRFKDLTIVSTSKMLVRGGKRSIRVYAEYDFAGKTQKKPEKITLNFYASAASSFFREDNLELNFLIDGKRVPLGEMQISNEEKTKTRTKQTVSITMPIETFEKLANGKKVEFQIGNLEYKFTDVHLEAFRNLLSYQIEE